MAHQSNPHRRMLASPETSFIDKRKHPSKPTSSSQNPHLKIPSFKTFYMLNQLIKPNPLHKNTKKTHPPRKDSNLEQPKSMSTSADFEVSKLKQCNPINPTIKKEMPRERVKKFNEKEKKKSEDNDVNKTLVVPFSSGGGERRRSLGGCVYQVELSDFLSSNGAKVVSVDMPPFMQIHAIDCARKTYDSLEKFTFKSLALTLKKEFDRVYGPAWHCILGTGFGSFVTYSVGGFLYFSLDQKLYILLFKTSVQRAD